MNRSTRRMAIQTIIGRYALDKARRFTLAQEVREIRKLGKSENWTDAVDKWAAWLNDETIDFEWAMSQGIFNATSYM